MQIEPGCIKVAGTLGYSNMVYACQKMGDKSLGNTEICNLYDALVVWRSGVCMRLLRPKLSTCYCIFYPLPWRKKSDIWEAFLDFVFNIRSHLDVPICSIYCWYERLPGLIRAQTKSLNGAGGRNWQDNQDGSSASKSNQLFSCWETSPDPWPSLGAVQWLTTGHGEPVYRASQYSITNCEYNTYNLKEP